MKNFLILSSIFIIALILRFYDYENRIIFWTEQALSLITSLNYLDKPSLLGQEYFRQDSNSHTIYSGALFNYILLPLILISSFNPLKITIFFTLLNILTGLGIYLVAKKFYGNISAMISTALFMFSHYMIHHSLFIWNYNILPLIGLLALYFTLLNNKKYLVWNLFILGVLSGFGTGIQIIFLLYTVVILLINIYKSNKKLLGLLVFSVGFVVGNFTMFLFDLRHQFYLSSTIYQYLKDTLSGNSDAGFAYYYLLPIFPLAAIIGGVILNKISKVVTFVLIVTYLLFNIYLIKNMQSPPLKLSELNRAAEIIALDSKGDFNVTSLIDFDKRAYALRYFLKYKYQVKVMSVDSYPNSQVLYALSSDSFDYSSTGIWEIKSGWPYEVKELTDINEKYTLYKLTK